MMPLNDLWTIISRIAGYPNAAFLGAILLGLAWPLPGLAPDSTVLWATAALMVLALVRMPTAVLGDGQPMRALILPIILRFLLLPLLACLPFAAFGTEPELAAFLLFVVPAGIAVPALVGLAEGSIQTGMKITLMSSAAALLTVPGLFWLKFGATQSLRPAPSDLALTLLILIVLPWVLVMATRRIQPKFVQRTADHAPVLSVLLFAATVTVIISKIRDQILAEPMATMTAFCILGPVFAITYGTGVLLSRTVQAKERSALIIGSGAMNNNMAMAIGFEHFGPGVVQLLVLSEIMWILSFLLVSTALRKGR